MRKLLRAGVAVAIGITGLVAPTAGSAVHADSVVLRGTVVDETTNLPIEDASIALSYAGFGGTMLIVHTDATGAFEIVDPPPSPSNAYRLDATVADDRLAGEFVVVDQVEGVTEVSFELGIGGTISGSIYGLVDDELISGLCVFITDLSGNAALGGIDFGLCSGPDGRYGSRQLPPGDYLVSVSDTTFPFLYGPVVNAPVSVVAGEVTDFNIALEPVPPSIITGQIVDSVSGEPLAGVMVESTGAVWTSDDDGRFTAEVTGRTFDGSFELYFFDPTGLHVNKFVTLTVQPGYVEAIVVELDPAGAIEGTLTGEDGQPVQQCFSLVGLDVAFASSTCSDHTGHFSVARLPTGTYEMYIASVYPFRYRNTRVGPIHVVAGSVTNADTVLPLAETGITGEVVDNLTGAPIEGLAVRAQGPFGFWDLTTSTDAAGEFAFDLQPYVFFASAWTVTVSDPLGRYRAAGPFDLFVQPGYVEPIGISLEPVQTRVAGEVTDEVSGAAVAGARVSVTPFGTGDAPIVVLAEADGSFDLDVSPYIGRTTRFRVQVSDPSGRYAPSSSFDVFVQAGYTELIGISLAPLSTYSATFTPSSVDPPPALNVARVSSTVNLVWTVRDGSGLLVGDRAVVDSVTFAKARCTDFSPMTPAKPASGVGPGVTVSRVGQYKFGWRTPAGAGCYTLTIELTDGTTLDANFRLRA